MKLIADLEALREKYLASPKFSGERAALSAELIAATHNALPAILTALRAGQDWIYASDAAFCAVTDIHRLQSQKFKAEHAFRHALAALGEGPR